MSFCACTTKLYLKAGKGSVAILNGKKNYISYVIRCEFKCNKHFNFLDHKFGLAESFNQMKKCGYWCHTCMLKPLEHGFWCSFGHKLVFLTFNQKTCFTKVSTFDQLNMEMIPENLNMC